MPVRLEERVASSDPAEDDIDAIAKCHLPIIEAQHHGDGGSRLNDFLEPRTGRLAGVGEPVGPGTGLDRCQIAVEKPGPPNHADHIANLYRRDRCWPPCALPFPLAR